MQCLHVAQKYADAQGRDLVVNEAGCGDLYWMRHHYAFFEFYVDYHGYDLHLRDIHQACKALSVTKADITQDIMRDCDVILSRLVFIHLPNDHIAQALEKFKATGARYLITNRYRIQNNEGRHTAPSYVANPYRLDFEPFNLLVSYETRNMVMLELNP